METVPPALDPVSQVLLGTSAGAPCWKVITLNPPTLFREVAAVFRTPKANSEPADHNNPRPFPLLCRVVWKEENGHEFKPPKN